jgi:hypothetical protein
VRVDFRPAVVAVATGGYAAAVPDTGSDAVAAGVGYLLPQWIPGERPAVDADADVMRKKGAIRG